MHYRTNYDTDPDAESAAKLKNYVTGDAVRVVTEAGLEADSVDKQSFETGARNAAETRQHTISMADVHDIDDLAEGARTAMRECDAVDGNWMVGIHDSADDENPHIHVAEFSQERRGTDFDIYAVRDTLEDAFPEEPTAW